PGIVASLVQNVQADSICLNLLLAAVPCQCGAGRDPSAYRGECRVPSYGNAGPHENLRQAVLTSSGRDVSLDLVPHLMGDHIGQLRFRTRPPDDPSVHEDHAAAIVSGIELIGFANPNGPRIR